MINSRPYFLKYFHHRFFPASGICNVMIMEMFVNSEKLETIENNYIRSR